MSWLAFGLGFITGVVTLLMFTLASALHDIEKDGQL